MGKLKTCIFIATSFGRVLLTYLVPPTASRIKKGRKATTLERIIVLQECTKKKGGGRY